MRSDEQRIKEEIRDLYRLTYPSIIFNLVNQIDNLKEKIKELETKIKELNN